jgi:hypothetical protein
MSGSKAGMMLELGSESRPDPALPEPPSRHPQRAYAAPGLDPSCERSERERRGMGARGTCWRRRRE